MIGVQNDDQIDHLGIEWIRLLARQHPQEIRGMGQVSTRAYGGKTLKTSPNSRDDCPEFGRNLDGYALVRLIRLVLSRLIVDAQQ